MKRIGIWSCWVLVTSLVTGCSMDPSYEQPSDSTLASTVSGASGGSMAMGTPISSFGDSQVPEADDSPQFGSWFDPPLPPIIQIVDVMSGGNGCPQGTARTSMSADHTKVSVLFDNYVAETEPGRMRDRKSCQLAVSLAVPPGLSAALFKLDYRGYAAVPVGGKGAFRAEYFFAGARGPILQRNFPSGYDDIYMITDEIPFSTWSPCGEQVIARSNTSVLAEKSDPWAPHEGMIAVDSADIRAEIDFYLMWRTC